MAQIITPNHRPQMATVRYKVMDAPARQAQGSGTIENRTLPPEKLQSGVTVLSVTPSPRRRALSMRTCWWWRGAACARKATCNY